MPESDLLYHDLTRTIIGAFFEAHRELGSGFLEAIYKNGLVVLLRRAGLRVEREVPFEIIFHAESLGSYRADIVVERKVVVEVENGSAHRPGAHRAGPQLFAGIEVESRTASQPRAVGGVQEIDRDRRRRRKHYCVTRRLSARGLSSAL